MSATILLSPAVTALPLLTPGHRRELSRAWAGPVLGMGGRGAEHKARLAGARTGPEWLAGELLSTAPETHPVLVIVHDEDVALGGLRQTFPSVRIEAAVVDAEAYTPGVICAAVQRALAQPSEAQW